MSAPWERLEKESYEAWEAFVCYRDMGASRSTAKVGRQLSKSKALMDRWSGQYLWVERSNAWDAFLDAEHRRGMLKEAEIAGRRHIQIAQAMQGKVVEKLQEVEGKKLTIDQVARWFEVSVKTERLEMGQTTDNIGGGLLDQAEAEAIIANILALVNGLIVYVPEENREEYRQQMAVGVARLLGKPLEGEG